MIEGIKNIIFDLGGVILNIDYQKPIVAFKKLGIDVSKLNYSKQSQEQLFDLLETGQIEEDEFVHSINSISGLQIEKQKIIDAWNSILLDFPLRRLQILQQLQLHYNMYLCSNTNSIHERAFNKLLFETCGYPTLALFFDRLYLSHRVHLRKPDVAIFELILKENNLIPEETLFLDDSEQHIDSAKSLGIQTIHIKDGLTIEKDIFLQKNIDA
ncbi:MAG: HAD family phosphatase [Chitinophagaceae bacterium]